MTQQERAAIGDTGRREPAFLPIKLGAPRLPPGIVRRSRLTETLAASRPSLLLVVAPPGFGKTSLLADWADVDPRRFAWVTLDIQDNDQAALWTYIGSALGKIVDAGRRHSSFAGIARAADPAAEAAAEIDADDAECVLVLDDYHLIESDDCHDTVMRFVELSPPNVQVAISARADPPLPVARLRATGTLLELRARDLQFAPDESEELLNRSLRLSLDPEAVEILHDRTEGWPAGLYLAYLSMRASSDRRGFVETFGASNRHVIDYLTEQILMALDPDTLRFMLATAIVDTVCGSLADAITGESGSAQRLIELEHANVFITPLDDRREWYRYHHLLAELLLIELERRHPDRVPLLRQRAAIWYADHHLPDRAVRHAIAAGDIELATRVISESYLNFLELGRTATILGWLESIPEDAIELDRRLGVVKAWTMHFLGRHEEGNASLAAAIAAPASPGPLPDGASSIDATAALVGAAFPGDDAGGMLASARRAFEFEASRESPWRTTVHVLLGFALARCGRWEEAREPLRLGADLAMSTGMWMDAVGAHSLLAWVELETGEPAAAEALAREALDLADAHGLGPTATYAYGRMILGTILVRRGDPDAADDQLSEALPVMRALGEPLGLAETLLPLSQARRALGRRDEASLLLREAGTMIDAMRDPGFLRATRRAVASARTGRSSDQVSKRELEVLRAMARGASKRQTADELFVSYNTVHSHVRSIYQKLDAHSLPEAVAKARRLGLLE